MGLVACVNLLVAARTRLITDVGRRYYLLIGNDSIVSCAPRSGKCNTDQNCVLHIDKKGGGTCGAAPNFYIRRLTASLERKRSS